MKEKYFFGYLYIKFSKFLAIIVVTVGVLICGSLIYNWMNALELAKYSSNKRLVNSLQKLLNDYGNSKQQALELHKGLMAADQKEVVLNADPEFYDSYRLESEFVDLQEQIDIIKQNSDLLKKMVFDSFDKSVSHLIGQMNNHALEKGWIKKKDVKAAVEGNSYRLLDMKDLSSLKEASENLNNGVTFLGSLIQAASKEENQNKLRNLVKHLNAYGDILEVINTDLTLIEEEEANQEDRSRRVFKIIDRLNLIRESVKQLIFSNWSLDIQYEKTSAIIQRELKKCLESKQRINQIITETSFQLLMVVCAVIVVSVLTLVGGDFLKAIFEISENKQNPKA